MGGKSAPSPPDPQETAQAQTGSNISSAIVNQLLQTNQRTPYGSLNFNQTGSRKFTDPTTGQSYDIPQITAEQTLNPAMQGTMDRQNAARYTGAGAAGQSAVALSGMGRPGLPQMQTVGSGPAMGRIGTLPKLAHGFAGAGDITKSYGTDFSADRQRVEQALMARMNPSLEQNRSRLESQLSNQGVKLGTEAYDRAIGNFGQQENDARMAAILAGGEEQSRMTGLEAGRAAFQNSAQQQQFNQNLGRAEFGNNANQQAFANRATQLGFNNAAGQQEFDNRLTGAGFNNAAAASRFGLGMQQRAGAVNEMNSLLNGSQMPQPGFMPTQNPQVPTTDMAGLINNQYQGNLANWQQGQQNRQSMMGGLFGLGAAGLMAFSDERLKENIEPLGEVPVDTPAGEQDVPVYSYEYKFAPGVKQVGVMAQELRKVRPDAVVPMGKYLAVDYAKVL
jgi:hypothetical protein